MTPTVTASARASALLAARLAHEQRATALEAYRASIGQACKAGCTYSEVASTLGISRQAVRQLALTTGA